MPRKVCYESGTHVWVPPPDSTNVALEQLKFAKSKRIMSTHMFIVPRLFHTLLWRQLHKEADITLLVPTNVSFWLETMCEPLTIAFSFPYARHAPCKPKGTPKLFVVARQM